MNHPVAKAGVQFVPVTCPHCGHKGRSQQPECYMCSACYWERTAASWRKQADTLEARAGRKREEASVNEERARKFRAKHGTTSPEWKP